MKNRIPEGIAVLITATLLSLAVGFFWGRSTARPAVVVEAAKPQETLFAAEVSETAFPEPLPVSSGKPETAPAAEESPGVSGVININSADTEALTGLPGIGEVLAQRIVDYRTAHGAFSSVEDLLNVEGIGDKKLEAIQNLIELG